ncbi:MAG TPA: hypothetical protein VFF73_00210 [Planctomycetota bacterium]|nr:hypothetical protein [Planctomycetota bacterium]
MRARLLLLGVVLVAAATARADDRVIILKNGTRLTGEITSEQGSVLSVKTATGTVRVPRELVERIEKVQRTKPAAKKPEDKKAEPAPGTAAAVSSASEHEAEYAEVAALPDGLDRTKGILALGATIPIEEQADYLAQAQGPPFTPAVETAISVLAEQGARGREAALARLLAQNDCAPAIFVALARFGDKDGRTEHALVERLGQTCRDHKACIDALAARGTRKAVPALVTVLFFSPEEEGLTFAAQAALRAIARRDPSPDVALEPLVAHVEPGWPGPDQLVRRRDVLLAMGGSAGQAVPFLERTLALLAVNDLEPRGCCFASLARIGTRDAVRILLRAFGDRLDDAALEEKRLSLLVGAFEDGRGEVASPGTLLALADVADGLAPALRDKLVAALERVTGQKFPEKTRDLRRWAREAREKTEEK